MSYLMVHDVDAVRVDGRVPIPTSLSPAVCIQCDDVAVLTVDGAEGLQRKTQLVDSQALGENDAQFARIVGHEGGAFVPFKLGSADNFMKAISDDLLDSFIMNGGAS